MAISGWGWMYQTTTTASGDSVITERIGSPAVGWENLALLKMRIGFMLAVWR